MTVFSSGPDLSLQVENQQLRERVQKLEALFDKATILDSLYQIEMNVRIILEFPPSRYSNQVKNALNNITIEVLKLQSAVEK